MRREGHPKEQTLRKEGRKEGRKKKMSPALRDKRCRDIPRELFRRAFAKPRGFGVRRCGRKLCRSPRKEERASGTPETTTTEPPGLGPP
ncbi:hypothetical protein JD844_002529 [Phrynosoma platyrhinos]|uniref:Uncharacterized protein n=1 Tax=Phrynosoma platyrhinos TaxID=52577 RepID=A0ABQ7TBM0_PHRPL|nr:hypothetical protein JD844_002529 [Phrynosoma platyrhinos]